MIRYGLASIPQRAPAIKPQVNEALEGSYIKKVLAMLTEAANKGLPCPSNSILADGAGLMADAEASRKVSILEKWGVISITRIATNVRVVTITATGRSTALPVVAPKRVGNPTAKLARRTALEDKLYAFLCHAAEAGERMPCQREMAEHLGFVSNGGARYYLERLVERKLVRSELRRDGLHVYVIAKTGQALQPPVGAREGRRAA